MIAVFSELKVAILFYLCADKDLDKDIETLILDGCDQAVFFAFADVIVSTLPQNNLWIIIILYLEM